MFILQVGLLMLFVLQGNCYKYNNEVDVMKCKTTYTLGYGYQQMYIFNEHGEHRGNKRIFKFYVKAPSDAHILFTESEILLNEERAYEIVIGAGRNTFSVIRRARRKSTQATINTVNILSLEEYRGFWISIGRDGLVEVGKEGDNAPFLFWLDPAPIPVNYFSFCNWGNAVGQWAFSCPNDTQADEVVVQKNLTETEKLRNYLFTAYDPFTRPAIKSDDVTTITMSVQNNVVNIDERESTMSIVARVQLNWHDYRIQWDNNTYNNITKLSFLHHELWTPTFILFNPVESATDIFVDAPTSVTSDGQVSWRTQMHVKVRCNLDLSNWPHDKQDCGVTLGFWVEQEFLNLQYVNEIDNDPYLTDSQWKILQLKFENITIKTPWINNTDDENNKAVQIHYILQRDNPLYKAVFGAPLLAISIMTLLPFWISPLNSNKLNISCLNLIVMSIFVVGLAKILPAPADHVPKLIQTYSNGMLAITFSVLISVAVIYLARSDHSYPLPEILLSIIHRKSIRLILCIQSPSSTNKDSTDYGNLLESDNGNNDGDDATLVENPINDEVQRQWILLAQIIDRLAFLIYSIYLSTVLIEQI